MSDPFRPEIQVAGIGTSPSTPGYKTSEFWLTLLATLLTAFLASGAVAQTSSVVKIIGYVLSVLAALGYTAARTALKKA